MARDYGTASAEKSVPVTVNLPPVLRNLIDRQREACGLTRSAYIRMALFQFHGLLTTNLERTYGQETDDL